MTASAGMHVPAAYEIGSCRVRCGPQLERDDISHGCLGSDGACSRRIRYDAIGSARFA
jgi:hypothetical protein